MVCKRLLDSGQAGVDVRSADEAVHGGPRMLIQQPSQQESPQVA